MNPEQRFVGHGEQMAIETLVILIFQICWLLGPQGFHIIDNQILVGIHLLTVLPFSLFAKGNGNREEMTILAQELLHLVLLEEFFTVLIQMHDDVRTTFVLVCFLQSVGWTSVATPLHGGCILIALGDDIHLLAYHECAIESQTEMTDDGISIILIFLQEIIGT